jgi:hypothetical protein
MLSQFLFRHTHAQSTREKPSVTIRAAPAMAADSSALRSVDFRLIGGKTPFAPAMAPAPTPVPPVQSQAPPSSTPAASVPAPVSAPAPTPAPAPAPASARDPFMDDLLGLSLSAPAPAPAPAPAHTPAASNLFGTSSPFLAPAPAPAPASTPAQGNDLMSLFGSSSQVRCSSRTHTSPSLLPRSPPSWDHRAWPPSRASARPRPASAVRRTSRPLPAQPPACMVSPSTDMVSRASL